MVMSTKAEEFKRKLGGFTGTSCYYQFHNIRLTDGVKYLAEEGMCFWLLELIYINSARINEQNFQVWKLKMEGTKGILTCSDGNYNKLIEIKIPFIDFILNDIEIWLQRGVLLLPSEY